MTEHLVPEPTVSRADLDAIGGSIRGWQTGRGVTLGTREHVSACLAAFAIESGADVSLDGLGALTVTWPHPARPGQDEHPADDETVFVGFGPAYDSTGRTVGYFDGARREPDGRIVRHLSMIDGVLSGLDDDAVTDLIDDVLSGIDYEDVDVSFSTGTDDEDDDDLQLCGYREEHPETGDRRVRWCLADPGHDGDHEFTDWVERPRVRDLFPIVGAVAGAVEYPTVRAFEGRYGTGPVAVWPGWAASGDDLRNAAATLDDVAEEYGSIRSGGVSDRLRALADQLLAAAPIPVSTLERQMLHDVIRQAREALRLTREYVGDGLLPKIEGWSWYDAYVACDRAREGGPDGRIIGRVDGLSRDGDALLAEMTITDPAALAAIQAPLRPDDGPRFGDPGYVEPF